jgi:hypothetical protein
MFNGLWFRVYGLWFRVKGLGFRVKGLGFRVRVRVMVMVNVRVDG